MRKAGRSEGLLDKKERPDADGGVENVERGVKRNGRDHAGTRDRDEDASTGREGELELKGWRGGWVEDLLEGKKGERGRRTL